MFSKLSIITILYDSLQLFIGIHYKVYPILWNVAVNICAKVGLDYTHEIIISIVFSAITDACSMILQIPLSYYRTFSVEVRFGFNKQTRKVCAAFFILLIYLRSFSYFLLILLSCTFNLLWLMESSILFFCLFSSIVHLVSTTGFSLISSLLFSLLRFKSSTLSSSCQCSTNSPPFPILNSLNLSRSSARNATSLVSRSTK